MAQSNFSGTSLWLLVLGWPTCLFTDCLLCWVDIFALCRESSSLKKEETSSALQTRCFVDRVSSSPSDSSEDIIDKCNASNNSDFFSSSVTTLSLFSSFSFPCSTTVLTVPSWSGSNAKDQGAVRFFFFLKNSAASLHHSFQSHGWLVWLLAWISCLP